MSTGWVWHERYAWHDTRSSNGGWLEPAAPFESGETKRRLRNLVEVSGLLAQLEPLAPRAASDEEILRVHTREYYEHLRAIDAAGGDAGEETPMRAGSLEIARLAAGGAIVAVEAVLDGRVENAYALVRPPGHHALPDRAMGFCLLNNVAVAARAAQAGHGCDRVAIVDWDVHHGNGTEAVFRDDATVLTISLHQDGWYPVGSGGVEDNNEANINVPLPAGSGLGAYLDALERVVIPALERFAPDLVLVACGLDAGVMDPLGRQLLTSDGFRTLTQRLLDAVPRVVCIHEGGYSPVATPFYGLAVIETLASTRTAVSDPYLGQRAARPGQALLPHHAAAVDAAAATLAGL
jgi:acetoin utilization deacetylase AcuC-like enzyme